MTALHQLNIKAKQIQRNPDIRKGRAGWGNYQCWWLSFLEVARASEKLHDIFQSTGRLGAYYAQHAIPAEGVVPEGFLRTRPMCEAIMRVGTDQANADWTALKNNLVYGPEWQRMIMFYLLDPANGCNWKMPSDEVNTSYRPSELHVLRDYLGIAGIEVETGKSLSFEVEKKVSGLKNLQWLIVDKPKHAMAAQVQQLSPATGTKLVVNRVNVYNQASGAEFACELTKDKTKLKSTTGDTVLTYFFIVST